MLQILFKRPSSRSCKKQKSNECWWLIISYGNANIGCNTFNISNKLNNIYFCTTIQELINKGLLDKNAKNVEGNTIGLNDYIAVVKDKKTKVIKKEFVLTASINENEEDRDKTEAYKYCTGNKKPEDIKKLPIINKKNTWNSPYSWNKIIRSHYCRR